MSGISNPYEEMYKKWIEQNMQTISEMQKNFEQMSGNMQNAIKMPAEMQKNFEQTKQMWENMQNAIKMPAEMQKNFEQVNKYMQNAYTPDGWSKMNEQVNDMSKIPQTWTAFIDQMSKMSPWQQPREQLFVPNMLMNWAAFKTSIGSNGRISIPEAERSALKIREGDLVQVIVLPVSKREVKE